MLADLIRRVPMPLVYRKRLPKEFGNIPIYVTPKADMRVLYPGYGRCAHDLMLIARHFVKPGDVVWDIGSNQGIFSVLAANQAGKTGIVYSVEAEPTSAAQQHRTFMQLPSDAALCSVLSAAVADQLSVLDFAVSAKGSARSGLAIAVDCDILTRKPVVSVTLDFLLQHWPAPDVLKLDVEGSDLLAFRGARKLLEHGPIIYFEPTEATFADTRALLEGAGYTLHHLKGDGSLVPLERFSMYVVATSLTSPQRVSTPISHT